MPPVGGMDASMVFYDIKYKGKIHKKQFLTLKVC